MFSTTFHVALLRIKKAIKGECNSIDAMAGPSNYVVDFTNAVDDNENLQLVLYWHVGGATYQVNNPRLLRHEWLDDSAIQRKWVVKKDMILAGELYFGEVRQLCFGFLNR